MFLTEFTSNGTEDTSSAHFSCCSEKYYCVIIKAGIRSISATHVSFCDRVLVLPKAAEEKTIGGIIIPDTAKEKPLQGEVVACGNGTKDEEMVLKVGDQVLYGKYSGTELEYEGVKYLMMRQSDVLAILK